MTKVLYVEMFEASAAWDTAMMGASPNGHRRIVRITLTPEQEKAIKPRWCGSSGGKDFYEQVAPVSIQEDNAE